MNLERRSDIAALMLRCATGVLFLAHGFYLKLFVFGLDGTVGFFQSLGYPALLAHAVIIVETLGGLALILGLWSRWASLALLPVLAGAFLVHAGNGWLFSAPNGGWEYPLFWIVVQGVVAVLGDGAYTIRRLIPARAPAGASAAGL